jgi:hypothetical protein
VRKRGPSRRQQASRRKRSSKERARRLRNRQRRITYRLRERHFADQPTPVLTASNIHYELAERTRGLQVGGIGAVHQLARVTGLVDAIDRRLELLKVHVPYHESDHVLNFAYNILAGGTRLEDIELRRNDEVFLDALGAERIPDPTTAGDFCRRFGAADVEELMAAINEARLGLWQLQPREFFEEARIDGDGTFVQTSGECKEGMDISHKGQWGFHPLVVSLANTAEPLFIVNRSGNRPSHEGAARRFDQAVALCRRAGFRRITLRGDTDFSQTTELDRWTKDQVRFVFGYDAAPSLVARANQLPEDAWSPLVRPPKYRVKTQPRRRPDNVKERIVYERDFENLRLVSEHVAELCYSPRKCKETYRLVIVRKNLSVEKGDWVLFDDLRYFFYLTNDFSAASADIVFEANARCDQENLLAQLKGGVRALHAPVNNLVANWAYMVMASLAWTLKAWFALSLPAKGRWKHKHQAEKDALLRMEFKSFLNAIMWVPAQLIRRGRQLIYRLLAWNRWQAVFFRAVDALHQRLRC